MRVLFLHSCYQEKGGEDSVFRREVELLSQSHDVSVEIFQNRGGWRGALQFFLSVWNVFAAKKLKKKIIEFKPDVVHIHNLHFAVGPIAIRVARKCGVRIVVTLHNYRLLCPSAILLHKNKIFTHSLRTSFPWKAIGKKVYRNSYLQTFWMAFINWFHKKAGTWQMVDRYIVLTEFSKQLFRQSNLQLGSEKMIIKPNFVNDPLDRKLHRTDAFLFVGRLSEEKGISLLLDAFIQSPFDLHIVGDGPLEKKVSDIAAQHYNIQFLGKLAAEEVRQEMLQCTALVFPSICYEGMPMTIIEAFAASTPVIASHLGAMESIIKNEYNGLHFRPSDANNLRKQLETWNSMTEVEKESFRYHAYKTYKSNYTSEKNFHQLTFIYNDVIKCKK